ncbi:MAG TPA: gliding motility-associated ABC transporter permease subunit GldF [Paludibacteraceae bacterium]|nr:gliding motility-associated ABC transporter permease subunit GldF [Paludibacteraceae bacterium]HPT44064.1 gliding motility-associated ABC transporter permease subunit GldF [Paludibacteraceae bacterium]
MLSVLKKELRAFFSSATGYIVIGIFLLLTGLFLWVIPGEFNILDSGYANTDGLFYLAPWLFLLLCPAIAMRFFAEEKQTGTWELIITKPLTTRQIVMGKYFAGTILVILALIPTLIYYYTVSYLAEPVGNVDAGQFWGSFIGLLFLGSVYMAIGTFSSSLTRNQIIAFIIGLVLCFFFFYGFDVLTSFVNSAVKMQFVEDLGIHAHYKSISRGVIDTTDVIYFVVLSTLFLEFTVLKLKRSL